MLLTPNRVDPGPGAATENRARQLRYLDQAVDADHEGDKEGGQHGQGIRDADLADDLKHRREHLGENIDKGRSDDLIETEADECLEPAPEEPVHPGHDEPWNEHWPDQHTDR